MGLYYYTYVNNDRIQIFCLSVPVSRPVLEPKELTVTEGSDLPLICRVHQGTYPITFTWYHNRVMLLSSIQKLRSLEGRHVIKDIDRDQRGDYYCEASNYASEPKKSYPARIGGTFFNTNTSLPFDHSKVIVELFELQCLLCSSTQIVS